MFTLDLNKVLLKHRISQGNYSAVYPYGKTSHEKQWVVKVLKAEKFEEVLKIMEEIVLGFNLNHPAVVPIRGYHVLNKKKDNWEVYIKLPRMRKDLRKMLFEYQQSNTDFSEEEVIKYFHALASALEYLHSRRIAHRDIKPENILIDYQGNIKISDVGGAKYIAEGESFLIVKEEMGTPIYSAPETLPTVKHLKMRDLYQADIWSLGVVIAEICTGKRVYGSDNEEGIKKKTEKVGEKYSVQLINLLLDVLKIDPAQRKTAGEIKRVLEENFSEILATGSLRVDEKEEPEPEVNEIEMIGDDEEKKENEEEKEDKVEWVKKNFEKIQKEMDKIWKDVFTFELDSTFTIRASEKEKERIMDKNLSELVQDLKESLEGNDVDRVEFDLFKCKKISDQGIKEFIAQIRDKLNITTYLGVNLSGCNKITNDGVKELGSIVSLMRLQELSLNFYECDKVTDQGIQDLSYSISANMDILKRLHLNFGGCSKITDPGVRELGLQMSMNLKELTHLNLNLSKCDRITNPGVKDLSMFIGQNLNKLQHLDLNFGWCNKLKDPAFKDLVNNIKPILKNLQHLTLNFWKCDNIKDHELADLVYIIGATALNLTFFDLNLGRCNNITDKGVREIKNHIVSRLNTLTHFRLNFDCCGSITGDVVAELANQISINLKNLRHLDLSFEYCSKVEDLAKILIRSKLNFISELNIK